MRLEGKRLIAVVLVAALAAAWATGAILNQFILGAGPHAVKPADGYQELGEIRLAAKRDAAEKTEAKPQAQHTPSDTVVPTERLIVRTAYLSLVADDPAEAAYRVRFEAEAAGGYVESMQIYSRAGRPSAQIVIRVPEARFFEVLDRLRELGVVEREEIRGEDVTDQYIDLEARLRNLKAEEEWLLDIMKRAETVEELMMVEGKLWEVREKIERLTAQLKNLERRASYSSITVSIHLPPEPEPGPQPPTPDLIPVIYAALAALYTIISGAIYIAIAGWPIALMGYAAHRAYKRIRRH